MATSTTTSSRCSNRSCTVRAAIADAINTKIQRLLDTLMIGE
jgi:hypothetical protein